MNTWGLLQSMLTLQETQRIHDSVNVPKLDLSLIFAFYYKFLKY